MRILLRTALISLACTIGAGPGSQAEARCDSGERIIRLGVAKQSGSPERDRAIANLRSAINLEMQGRACLRVLTDDTQFASSLAVTALQAGSIELAVSSFTELGDFAPDFKLFDLPFAFKNLRSVQRFSVLVGPRLNDQLEKFDVIPMAVWHGYFDQISAKQPVYLPSDLAGLRVAASDHKSAVSLITTLDGVAQSVDPKDLAASVKDGRIDGQFANWLSLRETKSAEIHNGVTETNHGYRGFQLLVSKSWWDSLRLRIKGPLRQIFPRITNQANLEVEQRQINAKRAIINGGAAVRGLTRRQRQAWLARLKPVWDGFENRELLDILKLADQSL